MPESPTDLVARMLALAGLAVDRKRPPPHAQWTKEEWERRVLDCIPGNEKIHCQATAEEIILALTPSPDEEEKFLEELKELLVDIHLSYRSSTDGDHVAKLGRALRVCDQMIAFVRFGGPGFAGVARSLQGLADLALEPTASPERAGPVDVVRSPAVDPLSIVAEALECFWNASIGSARASEDPTALAIAGSLSEGFAAIATRLRECAKEMPAASNPGSACRGEEVGQDAGGGQQQRETPPASDPAVITSGKPHLTQFGRQRLAEAGFNVEPGAIHIMQAGEPPFIPFDPGPGGSVEFWRDMDVCRRVPADTGARLAKALVRLRVWSLFGQKAPTPATAPEMNREAQRLMVEAQQCGFADPMWEPPSF